VSGSPFPALIRDGLGLAFGRAPRRTPLDAGFGHWLLLAVLGWGLDAFCQWFVVEAPREFNNYGLQSAATAAVLRFAACGLLCALTQRRALFWAVASWSEVAAWPMTALLGAMLALGSGEAFLVHVAAWWIALGWSLLILLRLALWLRPRHALSGLAALAATFVLFAPWLMLDGQRVWRTDWSQYESSSDEDYREPGELDAPEATFYAQPDLLAGALAALAPQRPDKIDLYALAFGGDASENVFRNEVEYAERLIAQRFDATGRSLGLLNHAETANARPLATATNLERALRGVGEHMDREQDILFLYLTSHGSDDHQLYLNQPPLPLDQLTPERLRAALDDAGIRWRVLVVSACYSGGYIDALRDPHTLVLTAASAKRTSFGCGAGSDITWFGKAFLAQALNETTDFVAAFELARKYVEAWEKEDDIRASQPQIERGALIEAHLTRWREGFTPGPALAFVNPDAPQKSKRR
jgi:hypothetical protein